MAEKQEQVRNPDTLAAHKLSGIIGGQYQFISIPPCGADPKAACSLPKV
jgi:hypothetical protein